MNEKTVSFVKWSLVALPLLAIVAWFLYQLRITEIGAGGAELRGATRAWNETNQPAGQALAEFMKRCPSYIIPSNRVFVINGTSDAAQFATTRIGTEGTLFITTNYTLILVDSRDSPTIFSSGSSDSMRRNP